MPKYNNNRKVTKISQLEFEIRSLEKDELSLPPMEKVRLENLREMFKIQTKMGWNLPK